MFRLFLRDAFGGAVLVALLAAAAMVLGVPVVAPPPAAPWNAELTRIGADPILLARDGALLLLALAALGGLVGAFGSGLRLFGRDYPALAHLTEALASRLARRAGALVGVALTVLQGGGLARATGPLRQATRIAPSTPPAALVHRPHTRHTPPLPAPTRATPTPPAARRPRAPQRARRAVRRVGVALRYIVQPDDTMDEVAARFGLPDWRPIMRTTRGLPQPVVGPITDPNRIWPGQILLIPLPCPALRLAGDHVLYVVQQGDYLSAIAARVLGDWRAYPAIAALNRGVHQPDGGALEDDNLIQPGWVLRLPQTYVVTRPDGATATQHVVIDHIRPRRRLQPRRRVARPAEAGATPLPLPHRQRAQPSHRRQGRAHAAPAPPRRPRVHPRPHKGLRLRPRPLHTARRSQPGTRPTPAPPTQPHPVSRRPALHPVPTRAPHVASPRRGSGQRGTGRSHQRLVPRRGAPRRVRPVGSPTPRPLRRPGVTPPLVHIPDLGRDIPAAFVLGFLALATAVATRRHARRRTPGGAQAPLPRGGRFGPLAPSVQTALRAALDGVEGRLVRALRRTPTATTGGARAAHVVAALERAGRDAGVPSSLAAAIRLLVEDTEMVEIIIEVARLRAPQGDEIAQRLGAALGVPVTATRALERDGAPLLTLTVKAAALTAPTEVRPHPAPLLVPLGASAEGAVIHVNLGRTGGLLVAGGGQSLVATLLASAVYQAPPDALRLLVASDDDELRKALPQLDHLEAPPADARDPHAVAALIAQAHTLVLDRYERYGAPATAIAGAALSHAQAPPIPCLLLLAGIEGLDDAALDRLDAVAHTGPVCGVHVLATTGDPAALAVSGMLPLFRTRLARRLAPEANALILPDADAGTLGPHEVVLSGLGPSRRLRAFTLTPPEVREVCATVAAASAPVLPPAPLPPAPAPGPASAPTTPSSAAPEPSPEVAGPGMPAARQTPDPVAAAGEGTGTEEGQGEENHAPAGAAGGALPAEEDTDEGATDDVASTSRVPQAAPPVRLDLLGGTLVFVHDRPITILPRERSLLAALAVLGPRPVPRADLIEALFADDADGGNTLSHALTDLRASLREAGLPRAQARSLVRKSSGGYLLNEDVVAVDLWRFDALLREAEGLDEAAAGPLLAEAFALYHGPLCGGEALGFVEEHGYRWMRRVPPALYRLADHYREAGDARAALHWTRRLLAHEPYDDHAHQLALNLLAELGDVEGLDAHMAEMRERYQANKQKIDPYTLRLYEQLRRKLRGDAESKAGQWT